MRCHYLEIQNRGLPAGSEPVRPENPDPGGAGGVPDPEVPGGAHDPIGDDVDGAEGAKSSS